MEGLSRLYNVQIQHRACDLTDAAAREAFWETIRSRDLRFHLLINVAGIDFEGPFTERSPEELGTIVRLNVEAVVAMTRMVLPSRDKARTLRIVNVSSLAGFYPMPVAIGSEKKNVLPLPNSLWTQIRPAWASTSFFVM